VAGFVLAAPWPNSTPVRIFATRIWRCDIRREKINKTEKTNKTKKTKAGTHMTRVLQPKRSVKPSRPSYVLEEQIGFILRQVWQRHAAIFAREIGINLTPTQWAALAKLTETGPCSQNQLGRLTAMDVATIKGVIDRLTARGLTETSADPEDGRRLLVSLTRAGAQMAEKAAPNALAITKETLAPLDAKERETLVTLLSKLR
jgi:DNA-binding MarR family transcriptional regulator